MDETTDATPDVTLRWSRISAGGPDAASFLQGQLSQDLAEVPASGVWSLLLAPDGVVITSLFVTPSSGGFELSVPRELGEAALTRLRRFLLRTNATLDLFDAPSGPYATTAELITAGRPGPAEFALALTPQCFGASFVASTVSFTKGCFTGQELVGRLDARASSVPWRMVRVSGPSVERVNDVLRSKGPAGTSGVTTSIVRDGSVIALGFAHRTLFGSDELAGALDVEVQEIV